MDEIDQVTEIDAPKASDSTQKVVTAVVAGVVVSAVAVVGIKLVQKWRNRNEEETSQENVVEATPRIFAKKAAPKAQ